MNRLRAIQHVANAERGAETIERLLRELLEVAARFAVRGPPVGSATERQGGRIAIEIEPVDAAGRDLLLPVVIEIRKEGRSRPFEPGMQIAVNLHIDLAVFKFLLLAMRTLP